MLSQSFWLAGCHIVVRCSLAVMVMSTGQDGLPDCPVLTLQAGKAAENKDLLGCVENELGLRKFIEEQVCSSCVSWLPREQLPLKIPVCKALKQPCCPAKIPSGMALLCYLPLA